MLQLHQPAGPADTDGVQDFSPIHGISGIPADAGRRQGRGQRETSGRKPPTEAKPSVPEAGEDYAPVAMDEATTALVEALDRLRATHVLSPAEETTRRLLRGQRYYQHPPAAPEDGRVPPGSA